MCSNNCNCNYHHHDYYGGGYNDCGNEYCRDTAVFEDVERLAREAIRRRCREDYCARQFCRCMRNARYGNSCRNECYDRNRGCHR